MTRFHQRAFELPQTRSAAIWSLGLICAGLMTLTGCLAPRRITIIDTATYELKSFPPPGDTWYSKPLPMDREGDSILCLVETKGQLEVIKHDLNGRIISRRPIPYFDRFLSYPHALSPDEKWFAYYTSDRTNLFLYDMDSRAKRILTRNAKPMRPTTDSLLWISDHEIVAMTEPESQRPDDRELAILKIDARTGAIVGRIPFPGSHYGHLAAHARGKLLAFAPFKRYTGISIFDLETMTLTREIPNPNKGMILNLAWNANGTRLVYGGGDDWLTVYSMQDGSVRRIIKMPENEVCYFIGFINENTCAYVSHDAFSRGSRSEPHLDFVDLVTGRLIKSVSTAFNGEVHVLRDGRSLVCWTGYQ